MQSFPTICYGIISNETNNQKTNTQVAAFVKGIEMIVIINLHQNDDKDRKGDPENITKRK